VTSEPTPPIAPDLPPAFVERLGRILAPADRDRALAWHAAPRPVSFRVNRLRAADAEVDAELAAAGLAGEPVAWCPGARVLVRGTLRELQATAAHAEGRLYVQGLSSMAVPLVLAPRPGERVLDVAAAPGSKTTQIAALMEGRGELVANDKSRRRFFKLKAVLDAQGVRCARLLQRPGESLGRAFPGAFDRVLLDAPCSGEGRFRSGDPASWSDWKPAKVRRLASEQGRLLRAVAGTVAPGGVLVYSTCTYAPEENERVVARFLKRADGAWRLEPIELELANRRPGRTEWRGRPLGAELERAVRIVPDGAMEGFFVARLRRA